MQTVQFIGADVDQTTENLRRLSADLSRLRDGWVPRETDLKNAPLLDLWSHGVRYVPSLWGKVSAHPILGNQGAITSELYAIDPLGCWARTHSRFYLLGGPSTQRSKHNG